MMRHFGPAIALLLLTGCLHPYRYYPVFDAASQIQVGKPIVLTSANGGFSVQIEVTNVSSKGFCILLGNETKSVSPIVYRASDDAEMAMEFPDLVIEDAPEEPWPTVAEYIGPGQSGVFETPSNIFLYTNVRNRNGTYDKFGAARTTSFYVVVQPLFTPCNSAFDGQIYDIQSRTRPIGQVYPPPSDPFDFR